MKVTYLHWKDNILIKQSLNKEMTKIISYVFLYYWAKIPFNPNRSLDSYTLMTDWGLYEPKWQNRKTDSFISYTITLILYIAHVFI